MGAVLPAPPVYQVRHKSGVTWTAYKIQMIGANPRHRFIVYAEIGPVRILRGTYRTRLFAALRCRRGH